MSQRLPISIPFPLVTPSAGFSSPRSHPRAPAGSSTSLVVVWSPQSIRLSPRIWKGRELLEGSHLDSDELHGSQRFAQGLRLLYLETPVLTKGTFDQTYASQPGPHQERAKEIYTELRRNVIDNVVKVRGGVFRG